MENELVPPAVLHGLRAVTGLRRGRSEARETPPVRPAPEADVIATLPHLRPQLRAAVMVQLLTAARPGEVLQMTTGALDRNGPVWRFVPGRHKTEHHGRDRVIFLGPRAQEIVLPWLRANPEEPLFRPDESMAERRRELREARKTKVQPSQSDRRKIRPQRVPRDRYTPNTYANAIGRACLKAEVPHWTPLMLRHTAATKIRREFGLEMAQLILGHAKADVTQLYAERDEARALSIVAKVS